MRTAGTGRFTRLRIAAQVGGTVLLALAALLLLNWLVGRPGWRQRVDLTAKDVNTLSTATRGVLARLEQPVAIDVFFRPDPPPFTALTEPIKQRVLRLLVLLSVEAGDRIEVHVNDYTDTQAIEQRRQELKLTGFENVLVVAHGEQREVVRLHGDLAEFDYGAPEPSYRPARVLSFDAEEAILQAVLQVTRGEAPKVYFSSGHGERELYGLETPQQLGRLHTALVEDGFVAAMWDTESDPNVPEDADAIAIVGPDAPFSEAELSALRGFLERSGRLVVAPASWPADLERSSVPELLEELGIEVSRGIVAQPVVDPAAGVVRYGELRNAVFSVGPTLMFRHPITDPLIESGRRVMFSGAHALEIRSQPDGGVARPILRSDAAAWLDLEVFDFRPDETSESYGPFHLAVVRVARPVGGEVVDPLQVLPESRVVVIGSPDVLSNQWHEHDRDFALNVFNWVTSREYRVNVSPRDPDLRRLPIGESRAVAHVSRLALWWLPLVCVALGAITAFLRRSGKPEGGLP